MPLPAIEVSADRPCGAEPVGLAGRGLRRDQQQQGRLAAVQARHDLKVRPGGEIAARRRPRTPRIATAASPVRQRIDGTCVELERPYGSNARIGARERHGGSDDAEMLGRPARNAMSRWPRRDRYCVSRRAPSVCPSPHPATDRAPFFGRAAPSMRTDRGTDPARDDCTGSRRRPASLSCRRHPALDHGDPSTRTLPTAAASLAVALAVATAPPASAQADETDMIDLEFDGGAVLILCTAPAPDSEAHARVFEDSFPRLIENMQLRANEGDLVRAHYLGRLKDGFFIVVGGDDIEEARQNAAELQQEDGAIVAEAIEAAGLERRPDADPERYLAARPRSARWRCCRCADAPGRSPERPPRSTLSHGTRRRRRPTMARNGRRRLRDPGPEVPPPRRDGAPGGWLRARRPAPPRGRLREGRRRARPGPSGAGLRRVALARRAVARSFVSGSTWCRLRTSIFALQAHGAPSGSEYHGRLGLALIVLVHGVVFLWQVVGTLRAAERDLVRSGSPAPAWGAQLGVVVLCFLTFAYAVEGWQTTRARPERERLDQLVERERRARYSLDLDASRSELRLRGTIELGVTRRVESLLRQTPAIARIVLDSAGGNVYEARGLARLMRENALASHVDERSHRRARSRSSAAARARSPVPAGSASTSTGSRTGGDPSTRTRAKRSDATRRCSDAPAWRPPSSNGCSRSRRTTCGGRPRWSCSPPGS